MLCPICDTGAAWPVVFQRDPDVDRWRAEIGDTAPYGWWLCRTCGNAYPSAQPDLRVLARIWEVCRSSDAAKDADAHWAYRRRISRIGGERAYRMFSPLLAGKPPGRFLDIACGLGEAVRCFSEHGWDSEGIDADPATQAWHREIGIRSRIGQFETLEIESGLDVIQISHAIYFMTNPMAFLRTVRRHLAPDGLFCIILADFMAHSDGGLPGYSHSFFPTAASMRHALSLAGFRTVLCRRLSGSIYLAARPADDEVPPRVLTGLIHWLHQTKALRHTLIGRPYLALRRFAKKILIRP
ncbi:MAG: methyltransferase domain-containing protein [Rhodospirillaceae bacterium]